MTHNQLVCITNTVRGLRPCTFRDRHTDFCDGIERRWVTDISRSPFDPDRRWELHIVAVNGTVWPNLAELERTWQGQIAAAERAHARLAELDQTPDGGDDAARYRIERLAAEHEENAAGLVPKACGGCLPRQAEHGLLCWSCWEKTRAALNQAADMITHLHSVERAQQHDNGGIRSRAGWVIPVPSTWRLADELLVLLGHPEPGFPTTATVGEAEAIVDRTLAALAPDMWVAREDGAEAAVRFYTTMQLAMRQHPMAEYEHPIRNVRCPRCKRRSLLWKPPLAFTPDDDNPDGRVRVLCTTEGCGTEMSQDLYDEVAQIEETIRRDEAARRRTTKAASAAGRE